METGEGECVGTMAVQWWFECELTDLHMEFGSEHLGAAMVRWCNEIRVSGLDFREKHQQPNDAFGVGDSIFREN